MSSWFDPADALPGVRGRRVHVCAAEDFHRVKGALAAAGFRVAVMDGARATDEASFFAEAERALHLPPGFGRNWDALIDSLGEAAEDAERSAILWREADRSLESDAQLVMEAVLVFDGAAADLAGDERPRQLEVFLFGRAPGFSASRS